MSIVNNRHYSDYTIISIIKQTKTKTHRAFLGTHITNNLKLILLNCLKLIELFLVLLLISQTHIIGDYTISIIKHTN